MLAQVQRVNNEAKTLAHRLSTSTGTRVEARPGDAARQVLLLGGVTALGAAAFAPALAAGFLADDFTLLRTLDRVNGLGDALGRNDLGEAGEAGHFYRPLWVLWNAAIFGLFGAEPLAFHTGNVLLYALIVAEVWLLARRLLGDPASWLAAGFFAVYPRHGESVAWVSGNTDLVASALVLAALLCAGAGWRSWLRLLGTGVLSGLAALAKESAFVLPLLVVVLALASPRRSCRRIPWGTLAAVIIPQLGVLVVRTEVLGGAGGYGESWTPLRILGGAATHLVGGLTLPQLEVILQPGLLLVPAALFCLLAWGVWRLHRHGDVRRVRVACAGAAWFLVALLPVLNLPLDLTTANGERLLFLPSVGLALVVAATVPPPRQLVGVAVLALSLAVLLVSSVQSARTWTTASDLADRALRQATELAPPNGELILLSSPDSYRNAHVLLNALPAAFERSGRDDVLVSWCLPVHVRSVRPAQVTFTAAQDGTYEGSSSWDAPFDFPAFRDPTPLAADCAYSRMDEELWPPGVRLEGRAHPTPSRDHVVLAFFDGRDFVALHSR